MYINNSNVWAQAKANWPRTAHFFTLQPEGTEGKLVTQSPHKLMLHAYLQVCGS